MIVAIFITLILHQYVQCEQQCNGNLSKIVNATQAFIFKFDRILYNWSVDDVKYGLKYYITFNDVFELPPWLGVRNEVDEKSFYVFGSAPIQVSIFTLQVISLSQRTYESRECRLNVSVALKNDADYAKYAIQILVNNVNINDMYNKSRLRDFISIFDETFWKDSKGISYVTLFQTAELVPGRRYPLKPTDKEGVLVHFGSPHNYSSELLRLEREVRPSTKNICPGYIKRMSVERFVRRKQFIFNWCYFHLIKPTTTLLGAEQTESEKFEASPYFAVTFNTTIVKLPKRDEIFDASVSRITFNAIWAPLLLIFILLAWLSLIFCLSGNKLHDPYSEDYFNSVFHICADWHG